MFFEKIADDKHWRLKLGRFSFCSIFAMILVGAFSLTYFNLDIKLSPWAVLIILAQIAFCTVVAVSILFPKGARYLVTQLTGEEMLRTYCHRQN